MHVQKESKQFVLYFIIIIDQTHISDSEREGTAA